MPERLAFALAVIVSVKLFLVGQAAAAIYTWDANGAAAGATDGAGIWNTTAGNTVWWDGLANSVWTNAPPQDATFGSANGTAGTVTIGSAITVGNLRFNPASSGNYTLQGAANVPANTITLSGASPTITTNASATIAALLNSPGGFIKEGLGTLTLRGSSAGSTQNVIGGVVTVNAGTLVVGPSLNSAGGQGALQGDLTLQNFARFRAVQGPYLSNAGTFTVGADAAAEINAFGDSVGVIAGGILKIGANGVLSGGAGIQASFGRDLIVRTPLSSDAFTINTPILANGSNALTKAGLGTLTLGASAINTYTGGTFINEGTLSVVQDSNFGSNLPGNNVVLNGGTLQPAASFALHRGLDIGPGGGTINGNGFGLTLGGTNTLTGSGPLTITGNSPTNSVLTSSASQNYTGSITIGAASLFAGRIALAADNLVDPFGHGDITVISGAAGSAVWVNRPGSIWTNRFFISGNGAEGRGVIRTEQGASFQGEIILTANAGIGSDGIGTTTTLNGNISGPFVLTLGGLTGANATNIYVLTGNNIHSATVIGLGITRIDRDVALGAYNGTTTIQTGATLQAGAAGIVLNPDRTIALTRGGLHYLDSQTYGISIEGTITGGASDTLVLRGGGHRLSATSSYAGATVIEGSTVTVETLANAGLPSGLGQGSPAPSAADLTLRDATVRVIPSAAVSTNRLFTLDGSGATLESSAASPLNTVSFTNPGPIALGDPAAHRFVLGGTNTGDNIFTPSLRDAVALPEPLRIGLTKTGVENAITLQEPIRTGLTKTGPGTWVLNGLNTFTDTTIIEGGTLVAASEGALGGTSGITVQTGGTLLLSNPATTDRINNAARMTLAGGRIAIDGNVTEGSSPGIGALTLTVDSTIDFAGGDGSLHFSDSHAESWTGTLSIYNWTSGSDHLLIGTVDHPWNLTDGGLTTSQLAQIEFYSGAGSGFLGTGQFIAGGFGQVVPVPEPSNIFAVLTLLGLAAASRSCSSPRESKKPTHAMPRAATGDVGCRSGASRKG